MKTMTKILFAVAGLLAASIFFACDWEVRGGCPSGGTQVYTYPSGTKVIGENTCQGATSQRGYKKYCWGSSVSKCYGYI